MPFSRQLCPYCDKDTLFMHATSSEHHILECKTCGARGPKTSILKPPSILPSYASKNLLRLMMDEATGIVILKNAEGQFLLCNKALADLYGTTVENMIGKTDADFNENEEQVAAYLENLQEVIASGVSQTVYETSTDAVTGEVRYYQSNKKPIIGPDGEPLVMIIAHDITDLKHAHQEIEESEKRYTYAMDASYAGMWDWDMQTNKVHHNLKWCEMLGLEDNMRVHQIDVLSSFIHPEDIESMMASVSKAIETNSEYSSKHRMVRIDGEVIWVHDRGKIVEFSPEGNPIRMVGSFTDITENKRFERQLERTSLQLERNNEKLEQLVQDRTKELEEAVQQLEYIATKDQLTGLGNRVMLDQWLEAQTRNLELVTILIDLDRFKSINDRYGHHVGDDVLKAAANCLNQIRESDLLVRWGGEEFLIILASVNVEQALVIAEQLRSSIERSAILANGETLTASFGICSKAVNKQYIDKAIQESDMALYKAKNSGRNQVLIYQENGVDDLPKLA